MKLESTLSILLALVITACAPTVTPPPSVTSTPSAHAAPAAPAEAPPADVDQGDGQEGEVEEPSSLEERAIDFHQAELEQKKTAPTASVAPKPRTTKKKVARTKKGHYTIPRELYNEAMTNPAVVASSLRVAPFFEGGKSVGFKLLRVQKGALLHDLGLRAGDVITHIGGTAIDSAGRALEVYSKYRNATALTLELLRGGVPVTLSYTVAE